jgi:hypothetical protein
VTAAVSPAAGRTAADRAVRGEHQGRGVDHDRQPPFLPDGGDAARDVPGGALGRGDLRQHRFLPADGGGKRLQVQLAVHRDDAHGQRPVHRGDQRLEHALRRDAERLAGLQAVGVVPRVMRVLVQRERDLRPFEGESRRRAASSHEPSP